MCVWTRETEDLEAFLFVHRCQWVWQWSSRGVNMRTGPRCPGDTCRPRIRPPQRPSTGEPRHLSSRGRSTGSMTRAPAYSEAADLVMRMFLYAFVFVRCLHVGMKQCRRQLIQLGVGPQCTMWESSNVSVSFLLLHCSEWAAAEKQP